MIWQVTQNNTKNSVTLSVSVLLVLHGEEERCNRFGNGNEVLGCTHMDRSKMMKHSKEDEWKEYGVRWLGYLHSLEDTQIKLTFIHRKVEQNTHFPKEGTECRSQNRKVSCVLKLRRCFEMEHFHLLKSVTGMNFWSCGYERSRKWP